MAEPFNLSNIQGDILIGLPKNAEAFFFFRISNDGFKAALSKLIPSITTAEQAQSDRSQIRQLKIQVGERPEAGDGETTHPGNLLPVSGVNIAFSKKGIGKLGITDEINDPPFDGGMLNDASNLGDSSPGAIPNWDAAFKGDIDGVVLVTGESRDSVNSKLQEVKGTLGASVEEVTTIFGDVRPGNERGHEHFGFEDGISQPAVMGFDTPHKGQTPVKQGFIFLGRDGDPNLASRPPWAKDGSFLAFRKLPQLVPEWNKAVVDHAQPFDPSQKNAAALLGARLVGRWQSGAPVAVTPLQDDPELANDPERNNDFHFTNGSEDVCPFAAHIRKMNPRGDLGDSSANPTDPANPIPKRMILRRGIPFGPEVSPEENASNKTSQERGLLFVCYQSNITNQFQFLSKSWANNNKFPPDTNGVLPGEDAVIGQTADGKDSPRTISGAFNPSDSMIMQQSFVISKGGEYFFSPSLDALKNKFAA